MGKTSSGKEASLIDATCTRPFRGTSSDKMHENASTRTPIRKESEVRHTRIGLPSCIKRVTRPQQEGPSNTHRCSATIDTTQLTKPMTHVRVCHPPQSHAQAYHTHRRDKDEIPTERLRVNPFWGIKTRRGDVDNSLRIDKTLISRQRPPVTT